MRPAAAADTAAHLADGIIRSRVGFERLGRHVVRFFRWAADSSVKADGSSPEDLVEFTNAVNRFRGDIRGNVIMTGQDVGVLALWEKHRTVMSIDPDLWAELGDTDPEAVIPAGLFTQLPYTDPFVAFPEPMRVPMNDTEYMMVRGFFVVGRRFNTQCSTHADHVDGLGLLVGGDVYEVATGRPKMLPDGACDILWTRMSVGDGMTLREMCAVTSENFTSLAVDMQAWQMHVPILLSRIMSTLVYLCARNADLVPVKLPNPPPVKRGKRRVTRPKSAVVEVGFRVGAELREHGRRTSGGRGLPSGVKVRPHMRRAHYHTIRHGKGRQQFYVKWLAPIPVNYKGPADRPTVHRVKGEGHAAQADPTAELRVPEGPVSAQGPFTDV